MAGQLSLTFVMESPGTSQPPAPVPSPLPINPALPAPGLPSAAAPPMQAPRPSSTAVALAALANLRTAHGLNPPTPPPSDTTAGTTVSQAPTHLATTKSSRSATEEPSAREKALKSRAPAKSSANRKAKKLKNQKRVKQEDDSESEDSGLNTGSRSRLTEKETITLVQITTSDEAGPLYGVGNSWVREYWMTVSKKLKKKTGKKYVWQSCQRKVKTLAADRRAELKEKITGTEEGVDDLTAAIDEFIEMDDDYNEQLKAKAITIEETKAESLRVEKQRESLTRRLSQKHRLSDDEFESTEDDEQKDEMKAGRATVQALKEEKKKKSISRKKKVRKEDLFPKEEKALTESMTRYFEAAASSVGQQSTDISGLKQEMVEMRARNEQQMAQILTLLTQQQAPKPVSNPPPAPELAEG
jgi:hypothetical protein